MKVITIDELIRILEKEIQEEKNSITYTEEDATYSLGVIAGLEKSKNILKNVKQFGTEFAYNISIQGVQVKLSL